MNGSTGFFAVAPAINVGYLSHVLAVGHSDVAERFARECGVKDELAG